MKRTTRRWPDCLWIVRHGESAGNVARDNADAAGLDMIDIAVRDMDVPLSELGKQQSRSLGRWFASLKEQQRPTVVLTSTYVRAVQTAALIRNEGGVDAHIPAHVDERLREREFGILDRLTRAGIEQRFPDQAEARSRIGKFYHRPPGGESWVDVILRLRSVLDTISLHHSQPGSRVLIVAHQVVVLCLRYLIEEMTEADILEIDAENDVANCGLTEYEYNESRSSPSVNGSTNAGATLSLIRYNFVAPLEAEGTPVTVTPDAPAAPR